MVVAVVVHTVVVVVVVVISVVVIVVVVVAVVHIIDVIVNLYLLLKVRMFPNLGELNKYCFPSNSETSQI